MDTATMRSGPLGLQRKGDLQPNQQELLAASSLQE